MDQAFEYFCESKDVVAKLFEVVLGIDPNRGGE